MGKQRTYNVLFHTHTISGIIISVALYVIFFAGSFAFFRDEIVAWERNEPVEKSYFQGMNLNRMLTHLETDYNLYSRDISFTQYYQTNRIGVNLSAPKDTTVKGGREFFYLNIEDLSTSSYAGGYSIGEFLYRLHFFAQLNFWGRSGYVLAGLVSFFFLFAIITGLLVHWKKIKPNFHLFRPKAKLKTIWTDAHTALGIIGFPFQFVFALTGTFLIFGAIAFAPPVASVLYDGKTQKMYADLLPKISASPLKGKAKNFTKDIDYFINETKDNWSDFRIKSVKLTNYGDATMTVAVSGHPTYERSLTGQGKMVFEVSSRKKISVNTPFDTTYADTSIGLMDRLHFGDFGGLGLRIAYFVLGLISCFVILSGILIWLVARDKKHVDPRKRVFNRWMGHSFLSICLSMYPTTAATFVAVKLFVTSHDASRMTSIYQIFFYSWLAFTLFFVVKHNDYFTNKYSLISGAIIGVCVPIANGLITQNWFWESYAAGHYDVFFVDVFWLVLAGLTFSIGIRLKPMQPKKKGKKHPLNRGVQK